MYNTTAHSVWLDLRERYHKVDEIHTLQLHREVYQAKQGTMSVTAFFGKLKLLWNDSATLDDYFCGCPKVGKMIISYRFEWDLLWCTNKSLDESSITHH